MSEILTIRNFGPIKNLTFELRVVNILIGDQGTGKSTVAKILSSVKQVLDSSYKQFGAGYTTREQKIKDFDDKFKDQLQIHAIENYLKPDSFIECRDSFGYLKYENQNILVTPSSKQENNKHTHLIGYIPAYREATLLLKDALYALGGLGTPLPKLFYYFGNNFTIAKKAKELYNYSDILNVKYKYVNDNDIIVMKNGQEINIEDASSAVNSGIPLLTVFDNVVDSNYPNLNRITHNLNCPYIIIEEPELNCFPTTQKKLMEHFISKIKYETNNGFDYYNNLVITTHSPYVLTSLNNMIYAYKVGQSHATEADKIIPRKYWLNPDDVSVYMLKEGGYEDIFDREEGLIKAEKIDAVTNLLNNQFSELLNLEFSVNEISSK